MIKTKKILAAALMLLLGACATNNNGGDEYIMYKPGLTSHTFHKDDYECKSASEGFDKCVLARGYVPRLKSSFTPAELAQARAMWNSAPANAPTGGDANCPNVGEQAVARSGEIAATSTWDKLPAPELLRDKDDRKAWFIYTAMNKRGIGSYVGQNAFGARVLVTKETVAYQGVAVVEDEAAIRFLDTRPGSRSMRKDLGLSADRFLWVAGPIVDGRFDSEGHFSPKFSVPQDTTYHYRADHTIKIACVAVVDKNGTVLQRF
jgi:hypothetical protein